MDAHHYVNSCLACFAMLVTSVINDPRVPREPTTFAARFQPARPVDDHASHGSTRSLLDDQLANEEGLPLWALGDPDAEPRAGAAL